MILNNNLLNIWLQMELLQCSKVQQVPDHSVETCVTMNLCQPEETQKALHGPQDLFSAESPLNSIVTMLQNEVSLDRKKKKKKKFYTEEEKFSIKILYYASRMLNRLYKMQYYEAGITKGQRPKAGSLLEVDSGITDFDKLRPDISSTQQAEQIMGDIEGLSEYIFKCWASNFPTCVAHSMASYIS
jgi:hypothetical protein